MTKLELVNEILNVNEQKRIVVKSHKYEDAAKLRDKEKRLVGEYEKEYGYIPPSSTSKLKELVIFLKVEQRNLKIDEILSDDEIK